MMRKILCLAVVCSAFSFAATLSTSPLADAAAREDKAGVRALLAQKADVNTPQVDGSTALHWAAHFDDADMVKALLAAGANAKTTNRYGITPLSEAAINGNAGVVEMLLNAGADPNQPATEGETPLMTASRTGNPAAVQALLKHGARVNTAEEWRGQTALMWAAAEEHPEVVKLLIANGAFIDAKSKVFDYTQLRPKAGSVGMNFPRGGFTPLLFAARQGSNASVQALVEAGANVNLADPDGVTALSMAIINFHYDAAGYLLEHGADANYSDNRGRTPLYAAIDMRNMDVTTRPSIKVDDKQTPMSLVKLLLAKGAYVDPQLLKAIPARGVLDGADGTLAAGATPFMRAVRSSDLEMMKLLLDNKANVKLTTQAGVDALMLAAGTAWRDGKTRASDANSVEAIKMLVALGLDVNHVAANGETALHGAAGRGSDPVIQILLDLGADVNAKDRTNRTAIDIANGVGAGVGGVRAPHESTIALLVKFGGKTGQVAEVAPVIAPVIPTAQDILENPSIVIKRALIPPQPKPSTPASSQQ
ncbi:MAG: ankyrin repeat domain-containing protein [Acidobacteriota bacterium]